MLIAVLALSFLTACGGTPADPVLPAGHVPESMSCVEISESYDRAVADRGYAAFAAELLRQCRKDGENTLVSPLSAALALGMTANGSAGETREAFRKLFGMDPDTLNSWAAAAQRDYGGLGGSTRSTLVNSLWCDPGLELLDPFTARCQKNYGAELFLADLREKATVDAVNKWISDATEGLIPKTVDEFSEDAVLALINAVYLLNRFERPFEAPKGMAHKMEFTNADGTVSHPEEMRNGKRSELYLKNEGGSGVVLPYDDGRLGFLLMLPDKETSLSDYLSKWDGETVKNLLNNGQSKLVELKVPKYEIEWSGSLKDVLCAMGLAEAFNPDLADFSAMARVDDGTLYIGDVIHKTVLKVNEKGTEAAAVTVVEMDKATAIYPPPKCITLVFDRPFVCGIVDMENGAPLFLGTVENLNP